LETTFEIAEFHKQLYNKCSRTFAKTCTSSLPGIIKVFEGALLTDSAVAFCPRKEPSFVKRAIFKMIPKSYKQVNVIDKENCMCSRKDFHGNQELDPFTTLKVKSIISSTKPHPTKHTKIFFIVCCMKYSRVYRSIFHLDFHMMPNK
jgi:hypothetical protein